jgi:hypothetical protein
MYSFEIIPIDKINKIEYSSFSNKSVFTTPQWIEFIAVDNDASPVIIRITENETVIGYFSGLIKNKFGIKIFGSPFRGWSTCFMGFDLYENHRTIEILPELVKFIFKHTKCHYFECVDRNIPIEKLNQIPFKTRIVETLELEVDKNDEELLSGFKGDCRTFIRQFEKRGATIEIAEPNEIFAEEFCEHLKDVFSKQGLVPTYGIDKVKELLKQMGETDMLLCLRVKDLNQKSIATSIFLGYKTKFFFWGGASLSEFQHYRPNEYMIWFAIRYWRDRGLKIFDMVGVRDYKLKFGSIKIEYPSIIVAKYNILLPIRDLAERIFFWILKIKGPSLKGSSAQIKFSNLAINEILNEEIAHYSNGKIRIFSKFNKIIIQIDDQNGIKINLPINFFQKILGVSRLLRRTLRLDKSCILPTKTGYVAFWQGNVYHINYNESTPKLTLKMTGCRTPLHNSIANIDGENLYFGEYGNPHPKGKSIYHSPDGGLTWNKVFNISCEKIRHIHACKWDQYEQKIWVFTGDFEGQSHVICADREFKDIEWIGDGSQNYRATDAIFEKDAVNWIMDSPLSEVHHIKLNRNTRKITIGQVFPGPVWYLKQLGDGLTLACTVQEIGPSHKDHNLHLYASRNLKKWVEVAQFEHDGFKKGLMKYGVGAFADGAQNSNAFYIHFEAVRKFDGKVCLCSLFGI